MRILRTAAIIAAGALFIFSGTVKGIDPLGSAYKFHDYFQAFGLASFQFLSLPLSILLCLTEFLTGFALLTGFRFREGSWSALILMLIFTPLTLVLALTNPVSDCGCFGDAVHLTNWQTFWKNVVLIVLVVIIFRGRNEKRSASASLLQWAYVLAAALIFTGFMIYNLVFLPVADFLPYSTGTSIPEKMKIPEGAQVSKYETTFIYQKEGKKKEFTLSDYPADDSTWIFVEQRSRLLQKGYTPPIHDFAITNREGSDITDSILKSERPVLLMISKKLGEADRQRLEKGFGYGKDLAAGGILFYILTASGTDEITAMADGMDFCTADETTLKTMIRANPGYILLMKGKIEGKWSWAGFSEEKLSKRISELKTK
jgi:hypothetical protein